MSVRLGFFVRHIMRYTIGFLATGVAFALRLFLVHEFGELPPYITFYPAVMLAALFGGLGPGLLATVLSALAIDYWILPPQGFKSLSAINAIGLSLFSSMGTFMCAVVELYRRNRLKAAALVRDLALQAEAARVAQENERQRQWFHVTLTSIGDGVITCDNAGRVTFLNPVAELLTGWTTADAMGQPIQDVFRIIDEQTRRPAEDIVGRVLGDGRLLKLANHTALLTRAGSEIPIEDSAAPIHDASGNIDGVVLVFHDVTQKRRDQDALCASEATLRGILDATQESIWLFSAEGIILLGNQTALGRMDRPASEVLGRRFQDVMSADVASGREAYLRQVIESGQSLEFEDARDGIQFQHAFYPVPDSAGRITRVACFSRDITKRKQAEANQFLMMEILRLLNRGGGDLDQMLTAALRLIQGWGGFDAVGLRLRTEDDFPYHVQLGFAEDFLREENSLGARRKDGSTVLDAKGQAVLECTCGLVLSGRTDPSMPCFTGGGSFWTNKSTELLALPRADDPRTNPRNRCIYAGFHSVALVPVRSGSEIIGLLQLNDRREGRFTLEMIHFFEGLADNLGLGIRRKLAEDGLRAANTQLAEADHRKDEFLAMLAHELRNPLAPIRNAVQILKLVGPRDAALVKNREIIERQAAHMGRLLDDLLDVSRVTRGKIVLRREPLDLRTVVMQAVEVVVNSANGRGIAIHYANPPEPVWLEGDFTRLEQVVSNLLNNALKYTDEGWIRVSVESSTDSGPERGWAAVRVSDTGIGIAPDVLPRIFDLFTQADQSLERTRGGLGIGLTMVRSLVELHGGSVAAHSPGLGQGSEFTVFLPLLDRARIPDLPGSEPLSRPVPDALPLRVLVVDDNRDAATSLKDLLEMWGNVACTAYDGPGAVEQALAFLPDVILLDIGLPVMSGYAVARRLREAPALESVKIIALTGYGQDEDRRMANESGFDAHLVKPVDLCQLQDLLSRIAVDWPSKKSEI